MLDPEDIMAEYDPGEWNKILLPLVQSRPTREIVERTGLSRAGVQFIKRSKRVPRPETVERIRSGLS